MKTDETTHDSRIAIQPTTALEQELLAQLFVRLKQITDAPPKPDHVGTELVHYTLDLQEYDLDHDLWDETGVKVTETGQLDPQPGSRALVVLHRDGEGEEQPTEAQIEEAVESLAEGDDGDENEFTRDALEVAREVDGEEPLEECEEERLWELGSDVSTVGIFHIDVENTDDEEIVGELREYVDYVEDLIQTEIDRLEGSEE